MKSALLLLLVAPTLFARDRVTVCFHPGANHRLVAAGRAAASRIFDGIGLRIEWRGGESACANGAGIIVSSRMNAPEEFNPGALAYAAPYDRAHITVMLDRVSAIGPNMPDELLGNVLAHEICHILQGIVRHSEEGIMKPKWSTSDYGRMALRQFAFAQHDIELMRQGMRGSMVADARRP